MSRRAKVEISTELLKQLLGVPSDMNIASSRCGDEYHIGMTYNPERDSWFLHLRGGDLPEVAALESSPIISLDIIRKS